MKRHSSLRLLFRALAPSPGGSSPATPGAPPTAPAESGADFTLPYALVILGIGLGLLIVLHPTHRREREKPEQYQEKKVMVE